MLDMIRGLLVELALLARKVINWKLLLVSESRQKVVAK